MVGGGGGGTNSDYVMIIKMLHNLHHYKKVQTGQYYTDTQCSNMGLVYWYMLSVCSVLPGGNSWREATERGPP